MLSKLGSPWGKWVWRSLLEKLTLSFTQLPGDAIYVPPGRKMPIRKPRWGRMLKIGWCWAAGRRWGNEGVRPSELWGIHPVLSQLMNVEPPNAPVDKVVWHAFLAVEECLDLPHIDGDGALWQRDCGDQPVGPEELEVSSKVAHQAVRRCVLHYIVDC